MKRIDINDIKPGEYQGYIWYSDNTTPERLYNEELHLQHREGAFIVEGLLWSQDSLTSIIIRYHDGMQHVYEEVVTPDDLKDDEKVSRESYVSHRIPGLPRLNFLRYWKPEADKLCEGFEVLKPSAFVFVGFDNIKID